MAETSWEIYIYVYIYIYIYKLVGISLSRPKYSVPFATVPKLFCGEVIETFIILPVILMLIKSPVTSAVS